MRNKIAALVVALMASIGMVAVAAPVTAAVPQVCSTFVADDNTIESQTCKPAPKSSGLNRWVYCYPTPPDGKITFWDNQGFCGSSVHMNAPSAGQCRLMGAWDNWAGSVDNWSYHSVVMWASSYCGGIPFQTVPDDAYDADLYDNGMGNNVTSLSRAA